MRTMDWDGCRWQVEDARIGSVSYRALLAEGWQPFAVSEGRMYFRRPDPKDGN